MTRIFQSSGASAPTVDIYDIRYEHRPYCDMSRDCNVLACYQVRHPAIYDGYWRQACVEHLAGAVEIVSTLAEAEMCDDCARPRLEHHLGHPFTKHPQGVTP
jgi:hypothetical protein